MGHGTGAAEAFPNGVARLRAALAPQDPLRPALDRLDWVMALPSGAAPGFVYLAGACGSVPVGGGGADLGEAAGRLVGEASEVLAQAAAPEAADAPVEPALAAIWGEGPAVEAVSLSRPTRVGAPQAAIFPKVPARPDAPPRSLGLAAGRDAATARLAGLMELVERDALAAWWHGETRARAVCAGECAAAAADLARMRRGTAAPRPTTFLALPAVAGVAVACALSRDPGGRGLAFGFKAALGMAEAAAGAVRELLQMEIALEMARLREGQGRAAPGDAGPLARAAMDPDAFEALATPAPAGAAPAGLDALVARLAALGVEVTAADLAGLPGGLAVAKVFAPGLRPLPGYAKAPRRGAPAERAPAL
jgi:ribosomal protein S12 methylthiotransferase accessory factor YcaO